MENKLFELYTLADLSYKKHFEKIINDPDELYPEDWYSIKNYKLKIEIITEAIETNTLIENAKSYQNTIEGVEPKTKGLVI